MMSIALACVLIFAGYLVGIATGIRYCVRQKLTYILNFRRPVFPPTPRPAVFRDQLQTLTGLRVDREIGQLARSLRDKDLPK